jgi:hypothetical protein
MENCDVNKTSSGLSPFTKRFIFAGTLYILLAQCLTFSLLSANIEIPLNGLHSSGLAPSAAEMGRTLPNGRWI